MCETMANVPVEDNSSYVLTEDMIDAAMTEHFAYQDDIESEEDASSQDENMDVEPDAENCPVDKQLESVTCSTTQNNITTDGIIKKSSYNSNTGVSILVIETGLDKNNSDNSSIKDSNANSDGTSGNSPEEISCVQEKTTICNGNLSSNNDTTVSENKQPQLTPFSKTNEASEESGSTRSIDQRLPLLKKMLSEKCPNSNSNGSNVEAIDLCNSDTDEFSEDELTGVELIDDELKSVMESNLMAEVGITVNNHKAASLTTDKTTDKSPPKISVQSVKQITPNMFNNMSNCNKAGELTTKNYLSSNVMSENNNKFIGNVSNSSPDISIRDANQAPNSIQISKIAVPHQTFINSQGRKMKCVYFRNNSSLPLVINSNQSSLNSKNMKYMLTSQAQKGPVQMSPIAALANFTKKTPPFQQTILPKPCKTLSVAPKLLKPPVLKTISLPPQFHRETNLDSLLKKLLFHNLMKPYVPSDVTTSTTTYMCVECNDRFVLPSSLSQHLSRRSINILYWCRICKNEIQFFNRCTLFKHLRVHNTSIKHIDTTCITFGSLSKEMVDIGIVSGFLKDSVNNPTPNDAAVSQRSNKDGCSNEDLVKRYSNKISITEKIVSPANKMSSVIAKATTIPGLNTTNLKLSNVCGQTKHVSSQTQTSVLLCNQISSTASNTLSSKNVFPIILPKNHKLSVVPALQNQTNSNASDKLIPKSVILFCNNKLPSSGNVNKIVSPSVISTNVTCKTVKIPDTDVIIDDDVNEKVNDNIEEDEVDVENITSEKKYSVDDISVASSLESGSNSLNKTKAKRSSLGALKSVKRFCTECGIACINVGKHLSGTNRPTNSALACHICKLIMPTKCALKIHTRIHLKLPPYKCPDCGKDFDFWDDLNSHLKFSCGHSAKCIRFMCVSCKAHFPSVNVLAHHISTKHTRDIYKCNACSVAFYNKLSLQKHVVSCHPSETVMGVDYKQCSMFPKKLMPIDNFFSHLQEHTKNVHIPIYGYKCPMCSIVFANKMAFIIHQIKEKSEGNGNKKIKGGKTVNCKELPNSRQGIDSNYDDISQTQASDSNSEVEDEPAIIRKCPGPIDDSSTVEKDPLSLEGWEYTPEQRVKEKREELCIVCKINSVTLLPGIDLNQQSLCCKQCVEPLDGVDSVIVNSKMKISDNENNFLNRSVRSNTVKRKRSTSSRRASCCNEDGTTQKSRRLSDIVNDGTSENDVYAQLLSDLPAKKKSRKKQNKEKVDPTGQTHIQGQVITSKSPNDLVCSKCQFVADCRETFLEHITVHRTDPNAFQCLECGLCFVVLPSLERHLQMHHGIKDVNSYTEKNTFSLPQKVSLSEDNTDDNQCRVCYETFDSNSSLEKHFRTHGMAFMNSLSKSP